MCLSVPAQIITTGPLRARVAQGDEEYDVSIHLIGEPLSEGDWVAVHARRDAVAKLTPDEAAELSELLGELEAALGWSRGERGAHG